MARVQASRLHLALLKNGANIFDSWRRVPGVRCAKCGEDIMWDGHEGLMCDSEHCPHAHRIYWNADLRERLQLSLP